MQWSRQLFIGGALCLSAVLGGAGARHIAVAQDATQPGLNMAALQLPTGTRYSVTLANSTQTTLGNLQVSVQLPDDAVFDHALETPGFTKFQGAQGASLSWNAASFAPTDVIDAFTFFLQQPSSGTFAASASWDGDNAGQVQGQFQPAVQQAVETDADVTIDAAAQAQGFTPVGNTGVVIAAVSGAVPTGTTVHIRVLSADNNPPAGTGDLWWCSQVSVDGLPAGTGLLLQVPARQPLPPQATISLFTQNGAQWTALPDTAQVSSDGQSILYDHKGGVVAAGTSTFNQPGLVSTSLVLQSSTAVRQIQGAQILLAFQQQQLALLMVKPALCAPPEGNPNCNGFPPCLSSVFIAGRVCANGSVRAQGQSVSLTSPAGKTSCQPGGIHCFGYVGLLPGGAPAPAGHGTYCSFIGFTEAAPPSLTCGSF